MKIGLFADSHYSSMTVSCGTRRPSLSYGKIREAFEAFEGVDCVICLGDLVDHSDSRDENIQKLGEIMELIRSFGLPFYSLMGNHDGDIFTAEEFDGYTGGSYPPFSVCMDGKTLVFLNANYSSDGKAYVPGKIDWTDAWIPEKQIGMLRNVLSNDEIKEAVVFVHQNLDLNVEKRHIIGNAAEIREILRASGKVRKVIQGHYHPGHDSIIDGIEYLTLPAMCEGERNHYEIIEI